jgi:predicted glycosyltransferase
MRERNSLVKKIIHTSAPAISLFKKNPPLQKVLHRNSLPQNCAKDSDTTSHQTKVTHVTQSDGAPRLI